MRPFIFSVNHFASITSQSFLTPRHISKPIFSRSLAIKTVLRNACFQAGRALYQRFVKFGKRFSIKAFIPSFWSSVANVLWNNRRSYWTPSANVDS